MAYIGREIEYGVLEKQTLTADSSTTDFTLDYGVGSSTALIVSIGGVIQEPDVAYTTSGHTISFSEAPHTGDTVFLVYIERELITTTATATDWVDYEMHTGNNSTTQFSLKHTPARLQDLAVSINGVNQRPTTDFTLSGNTLTMTTAPQSGAKVLVYHLQIDIGAGGIADGTVTNPKIVSMDAAKLTGSLPSSMTGDLTSQYQDISTLGLQWANVENKVAFNLTDDFMDVFQDSTGMDSGNSTNTHRDTSGEYVTSSSQLDTAKNIAPSSNDWDYTNAQGEWPVAGNSLGDHTDGAYIDNTGGDSCFRSLITFDGDFEITFTGANFTNLIFCLYEISEDAADSAPGDGNATIRTGMTNYWAWITGGGWTGHSIGSFVYNNTGEGTPVTPSASDTIKLERVSGQINYYSNDTLRRAFTTTSSNPVRFWIGASGGTQPDIDDMKFVDHAKVQRDGFFYEGSTGGDNFGDGVTNGRHFGNSYRATRSGSVTSVKLEVNSVNTAITNSHVEIWTHDGTSPDAQVGTDSDTVALSSSGVKTYTFTDVTLEKGQIYWIVLVDDDGGSGNVVIKEVTGRPWPVQLKDKDDTLATLGTSSDGNSLAFEVVMDTSVGEPTPDYDTLLLVQSNTTDGSTTFSDSSQFGRTATVVGSASHKTTQAKFGTTSIYIPDGSTDYIHFPDSDDWEMKHRTGNKTDEFTVDFWYYTASTGGRICGQCTSGSWGGTGINFEQGSSGITVQISNNGSSTGAIFMNNVGTVNDSSWHHVALVRHSVNSWTLFIDGTSVATSTASPTLVSLTAPWYIGTNYPGVGSVTAYFDEFRVSRVARWDADFTPPTASYLTTTATTVSATGSLVSTASTADSTVSEATGVMVYKDGEGTNTIGTDLKAYFSADNGSNWTEAASYGNPTTFAGDSKVIPLGKTTLSNTGTQVKMKAEWANQVAGIGTEKTITVVGDTNHVTSEKKIDASSIAFDGTGDCLEVANHSDFEFSGDFTIDFWMKSSLINGSIMGKSNGSGVSSRAFDLFTGGTNGFKGRVDVSNGSSIIVDLSTTSDVANGNWNHFAFARSGNNWGLWVNGTSEATTTTSGTVNNLSSTVNIGRGYGHGSLTYYNGHLDEVRISNVARWTPGTNFTPSTTAYTTDSNTVLLIHSDTTNGSTVFADDSSVEGKIAQLHGWSVNY